MTAMQLTQEGLIDIMGASCIIAAAGIYAWMGWRGWRNR